MQSLKNLVHQSVDYAGLFPPAGLPLPEVISNYGAYLNSDSNAMLGRLVIPTARLGEIAQLDDRIANPSENDKHYPWKISALVPPFTAGKPEFENACQAIDNFNRQQNELEQPFFIVDSIELKTGSPQQVNDTIENLPFENASGCENASEFENATGKEIQTFLEIDHRTDPSESIEEIALIAAPNVFAKIRTGSIVADQIPTSQQVARFIFHCARTSVGFKATAGLHHPLRAQYRLTYDENPPLAMLFGFLNVFVASVIAFEHQVETTVITEILEEQTTEHFSFDDDEMKWHDLAVSSTRIAELRQTGILSFGSCSFDEPTSELAELF